MKRKHRSLVFGLSLFGLLLFAFLFTVDFVSKQTDQKSAQLLEDHLENALADLYALKGYYPSSLSAFLQESKITYDQERYMIVYDSFAENIRPRIEVVERKRV